MTEVRNQSEYDRAVAAGATDIEIVAGYIAEVTGSVLAVRGTGRVRTVTGSGRVEVVTGTGRVGTVSGTGSIGTVTDYGRVGEVRDSGSVGTVTDSARIEFVSDYGCVGEVRDYGCVRTVTDTGRVEVVCDSGRVEVVSGTGSVDVVRGKGHVKFVSGSGSVGTVSDGGRVGEVRDSGRVGKVRDSGSVGAVRDHGCVGQAARTCLIGRMSPDATINGGNILDYTITDPREWAAHWGTVVEKRGDLEMLRVWRRWDNEDLTSNGGRFTGYRLGEKAVAADWDPSPECGGGLHASPDPYTTLNYQGGDVVVGCWAPLSEVVCIGDKIKAPWLILDPQPWRTPR
jgi:hypothetical protein